ncbi:MAG: iron chaperone [Lachnospiraceae bacterium]
MTSFEEYLDTITEVEHKEILKELFDHIESKFPNLERRIGWNTPMYTDHGTFIIGFSVSKKHFSVNPEIDGIAFFEEKIKKSGYTNTKGIFRILWNQEIDYSLIEAIIAYNMKEKAQYTAFWRK